MATRVLHACEFREVHDVTPDGQPIGPLCGQPGRLTRLPNGLKRWVCDEHAERLYPEVRPAR